ncbi:hypothetical protein ACFWQC_03045 [Nocardioides sp. NPDC058538]|uniref:hypothetical protein n=1 Tax=Nocardioides sp. NPDC058538 TaxID=3346542 RepID=UPI003664E6F2
MTNYYEDPLVTMSVGTLRIDVWYREDRKAGDGGTRRGYGYRIADNDPVHKPHEGTDLESGVGADIDVHGAMQTLINFMSAAADAYRYAIANPGTSPESLSLFPIWVGEAAYMNDTELSVLTDVPEPFPDQPRGRPKEPEPAADHDTVDRGPQSGLPDAGHTL